MKQTTKNKTAIVCYPVGNILYVTAEQLEILKEQDLVSYDDEWTEEKPDGQWGFNEDDEDKILAILTPVNEGQQQPVPDANLFSDETRDKSLKWWVNLGHEQAWTLREKYFPHRFLLTAGERLKIYLAEHEGQQQPETLYIDSINNMGQIKVDKADAEIERRFKQDGTKWVKDFTPFMYVTDETDEDMQNPCELSDGYCWLILKAHDRVKVKSILNRINQK